MVNKKQLLLLSCTLYSSTLLANVTALETQDVFASPIDTSVQNANSQRRTAVNAKVVIAAEQLNQFGDQPIGDALRRLVSVSFSGVNRAREAKVRGLGGEYTQVLVNGRRILDANSKRSLELDRIPSSLVERVELVRTPVASQEGQGAAGTINIILKRIPENSQAELGFGMGHMEKNGTLGDVTYLDSFATENIRFNLAGGLQLQRRNESSNTYNFTQNGAKGGSLDHNKRRFEQGNFLPSVEIDLNENNSLRLQLDYLNTTEYRDSLTHELNDNQVSIKRSEEEERKRERKNLGILTDWQMHWSDATEINLSLDLQKAEEKTRRDSQRYKSNGTLDRTRKRDGDINMSSVAPVIKAVTLLDQHTLTYGTGWRSERRKESNAEAENGLAKPINAARTYKIRENIAHLFFQDTWQLAWGDSLNYGVRLEDSTTQTRDVLGSTRKTNKLMALPSFSYLGHLSPTTDWRLGLAKSVRRPDLRDLTPTIEDKKGTLASPDKAGNSYLKPETIWGADLGLDHYIYDQRGLLSANLFYRKFDNKIEKVLTQHDNNRWLSTLTNSGKGTAQGLELEARLPMDIMHLPELTLWTNFTAIHSRLNNQQTHEKHRFLDQPNFLFNAGLDYYIEPLNSTLGINYNRNSGYQQKYKTASGQTIKERQKALGRLDVSWLLEVSPSTSVNFSALNILAKTENNRSTTYDNLNHMQTRDFTDEDSYRTFYVKVKTRF